jgi:hypothetical protein
MTETITIRLRKDLSRARLKQAARGNLNAWANDLFARALQDPNHDWEEHFAWVNLQPKATFTADAVREASR